MRNAFVRALVDAAERDPAVMLLTGDLGFMALEPFSDRFPDRFINCGVSEQNMVGMATGLAEAGMRPFVYSIATFASMRPFEFVRNGPLQHHLPVCVVGIGGGMDYGSNGLSHYAIEDVALMRAHAEMTVLVPGDAAQSASATGIAAALDGPSYLRLEKGAGAAVADLPHMVEPGRVARIGTGNDLAIVAMGGLVHEAVGAADLLAADGIDASVITVSCFNPSPTDDLAEHLAEIPVTVAAEAHVINGGLGSFVCETVAEMGIPTRVVRCGLRALPLGQVGGRDHMLRAHGLSPDAIALAARNAIALTR